MFPGIFIPTRSHTDLSISPKLYFFLDPYLRIGLTVPSSNWNPRPCLNVHSHPAYQSHVPLNLLIVLSTSPLLPSSQPHLEGFPTLDFPLLPAYLPTPVHPPHGSQGDLLKAKPDFLPLLLETLLTLQCPWDQVRTLQSGI